MAGCLCRNNDASGDGGGGGPQQQQQQQRHRGGGGQKGGGGGGIGNSNKQQNKVTYCQKSWRVWRYCCCRYGYYPVIVAPVVTAACLLSLYSAAGCEYVDLNIGFTPSNSYNQSEALLGLFFYNTGIDHDNDLRDRFHDGCDRYPAKFEQDFITNDRTWKVARVMAMIAGVASIVCAFVVWLIVFTPLPVNVIWPGILLPLIMLSFIAEGSKFLIFDIALCSNAIWLPSGVDSLPQPPESCTLGKSAIFGIAAAALFLVGLLLICLHTPEQRFLDPDYGIAYAAGNAQHVLTVDNDMDPTNRVDDDDYVDGADANDNNRPYDDDDDYVMRDDLESEFSGDVYTAGTNSQFGDNPSTTAMSIDPSHGDDVPSHESSITTTTGENSSAARISSLIMKDDGKPDVNGGGGGGEPIPSTKQQEEDRPRQRVSESRISKMEEMEMNAVVGTDSLLRDLVSDLDSSLGAGAT